MLSAESSLKWGGSRLDVGAPCPVAWWGPKVRAEHPWGPQQNGDFQQSLSCVPSGCSLPSLGLSFLTCEMGRMVVPTSDILESLCRGLGEGSTGPR